MIKVQLEKNTIKFIKTKIDLIKPKISGIYFLKHNDTVVYVGKSINIKNRITNHIKEKTKVFNNFEFIECEESLLDPTELSYIYFYDPIFNKKDSLSEGIDLQMYCDNNSIEYTECLNPKSRINYSSKIKPIVNNSTVIEELILNHITFYDWKKKYPRRVELIKKGLLYEAIENGTVADQMIKKDNRRG